MKVSVVMSSYNHGRFVGAAIESVIAQDWENFEFVIRDDGSIDNTAEIIAGYKDPRIVFLGSGANVGGAESLNICISEAKGEYIAVINSDDVAHNQRLSKQIEHLDSHPEVGACFSRVAMINEQGQVISAAANYVFNRYENRSSAQWLKHFFEVGNCLCHPSVLIRKICYEQLGGYEPLMRQLPDFHFWARVCSLYGIHILDEALVNFRVLAQKDNASFHPRAKELSPYEYIQVLDLYRTNAFLKLLPQIFPDLINVEDTVIQRLLKLAKHAQTLPGTAHHAFSLNTLRAVAQLDNWQVETSYGELLEIGKNAKPTQIFSLQNALLEAKNNIKSSKDNLGVTATQINAFQSEIQLKNEYIRSTDQHLHYNKKKLLVAEKKMKLLQEQLKSSEEERKRLRRSVDNWNCSPWYKRAFHKLRIKKNAS